MFFCIPILVGCQTNVKPDSPEQVAHICPRCNNASVIAARQKTWFEFFFIPVVPLSSKHIWLCTICQWRSPHGPGQVEPAIAFNPGYNPGFTNGYNPAYQK
ncbi:hypothetical protein ARMSODRAFT_946516 [Armillaria solidipes]|uniref:Uncharacterized protein n=2 Tax=Armillaria TaxID=47424 RepID=A0A2H3C3L8_9AGAR|nr:hypothetical protein EV421DRAFT_326841 [Armillaria borealis]PBK77665.1 hypothetical protein ARMSODRAFT_946516 [Armillaria solidipes]